MNFIALAAAGGADTAQKGGLFSSTWGMVILIVGMFVLMYFLMIRPQNKQRKAEQEMRNSIEIGDQITTIGGIVGKVVSVKDDCLVIETGADKNKMKITRWAVQTNDTKNEALRKEQEAARGEKKGLFSRKKKDTAKEEPKSKEETKEEASSEK